MMDKISLLRTLSVADPEAAEKRLDVFAVELKRWNVRYNLVSERSAGNIWEEHIIPSLAYAPFFSDRHSCLDVGTGAGLPGMALKIAFPDRNIHLLDSNRKKILFCKYMAREMGFAEMNVFQERAENHTGEYDRIFFRAVAAPEKLTELSAHLLRTNGTFLSLKGKEEVKGYSQIPNLFVHELPPFLLSASFRLAEAVMIEVKKRTEISV